MGNPFEILEIWASLWSGSRPSCKSMEEESRLFESTTELERFEVESSSWPENNMFLPKLHVLNSQPIKAFLLLMREFAGNIVSSDTNPFPSETKFQDSMSGNRITVKDIAQKPTSVHAQKEKETKSVIHSYLQTMLNSNFPYPLICIITKYG